MCSLCSGKLTQVLWYVVIGHQFHWDSIWLMGVAPENIICEPLTLCSSPLCVENLDVGFDDHDRVEASQVSYRQPRVKPGELDQINGDFSTVVHQLNTQCTSGYIMRIHDIMAMSLYRYRLALILLSNNTILVWYDNMVQNIPTLWYRDLWV